ncbi:UNVERIFIED_CONTAM: actin-like protein ALP3b [Hammondia hammondi]|eukprot:XP_008883906.1 actin-like protein ALP3b [Hammondia hammondi]
MFSSSPLPAAPLVFDWGTHTLRAGVSGDALPRWVAPSVVGLPHEALSSSASFGFWVDDSASPSRKAGSDRCALAPLNPLEKRDHLDVFPVVSYLPSFHSLSGGDGGPASREDREKTKRKRRGEDGRKEDRVADGSPSFLGASASWGNAPGVYAVDIPGFRRLLDTACGCRGMDEGSLEGRSLLLSEPNLTNRPLRDSFAEMLFEDFKVSRAFLCKKAALACFGCARTSGIVADVGHSNTSVCAVQEGFVVQRAIREFPFGACHCAAFTHGVLQQQGVSVTPGFAVVRSPLATVTRKGEREERDRRRKGFSAERRRSAEEGRREEDARGSETTAEASSLPGFTRTIDEKHNEVVQVAPCPHVAQSYRLWGEMHIVEVLAQVLGECRSRPDASAMVAATLASAASPQASRGRPKVGVRRGKSSGSRVGESRDCGDGEKKREEKVEEDERMQPFVLPDGTKLSAAVTDAIRTAVPETLFSAPLRLHFFNILSSAGASAREGDSERGAKVCDCELVEAVRECVSAAGASRRDTIAAVIPTGGGTLSPGFLERFREELHVLQQDPALAPLLASSAGASLDGEGGFAGGCLRVVASAVEAERHFASWIGGSILGCLGSFSQFCVTQAEYEEYGARAALDRKCP